MLWQLYICALRYSIYEFRFSPFVSLWLNPDTCADEDTIPDTLGVCVIYSKKIIFLSIWTTTSFSVQPSFFLREVSLYFDELMRRSKRLRICFRIYCSNVTLIKSIMPTTESICCALLRNTLQQIFRFMLSARTQSIILNRGKLALYYKPTSCSL